MFRRFLASLTLMLFLLAGTGCIKWSVPTLDLSKYRDPRALDIDSRLAEPPPSVQ